MSRRVCKRALSGSEGSECNRLLIIFNIYLIVPHYNVGYNIIIDTQKINRKERGMRYEIF